MNTLRNELKRDFSQIPNELITDITLSSGALRVILYLFTKDDNWSVYNADICKNLGINEKTLTKYWKELLFSKWLRREKSISADGKFTGGYIYHIGTFTISPNLSDMEKSTTIYNTRLITNTKESKGANAPKQQKTFIPPTIEDINTYVQENSLNVDTKKFFKYYTASNWKDNKDRAVKNWKLKLVSWDNQNAPKQKYKKFEDMTLEEKIEYNEAEKQRKIEANYGSL